MVSQKASRLARFSSCAHVGSRSLARKAERSVSLLLRIETRRANSPSVKFVLEAPVMLSTGRFVYQDVMTLPVGIHAE